METTWDYVKTLAQETHKLETEVVTQALETGLRQLWREYILGRYLRGEIDRDEAIERIGIHWVEMGEQQLAAMREDLVWGLETR